MNESIETAVKQRIAKVIKQRGDLGKWCEPADLIAGAEGYRTDWVYIALQDMINNGEVVEIKINPMRRRFELTQTP